MIRSSALIQHQKGEKSMRTTRFKCTGKHNVMVIVLTYKRAGPTFMTIVASLRNTCCRNSRSRTKVVLESQHPNRVEKWRGKNQVQEDHER